MSRQHHQPKTETEFYQAVESGVKKFELRKNDRDFKRYDMVTLAEVVNGVYTGRKLPAFEIQYVLKGVKAELYGLKKGIVLLTGNK